MKQFVLLVASMLLTFHLSHAALPVEAAPAAPVAEKSTVASNATNVSSTKVEKVASEKLTKEQKKEVKKEKKAAKKLAKAAAGGKSQLVALLLAIFVGTLGIHRFYLGYTTIGIIQLLTLGGLGIWTLIDIIRIAMGDLQPKNGSYTDTL